MKKLTAMLLSMLLVLSLAGCGAQESNEITALFKEGYRPSNSSADETAWSGIFQKSDSWSSVYFVTAAMTAEQYAALMDLDFEEGDEEKAKALFSQLTNVTVTDITEKVPSQEELASYIGRTMGELEAAGFTKTGDVGDETGYSFYYNGPTYNFSVSPTETIENLDNYSENDLRALTIGSVEFLGFSSQFLDENGFAG